jgi:ATP-dependent Clp protease ATP-binding subunit ClpC
MSDKLDRFTKRARQALTLAQDEAQRLGHKLIGTEHLLLGLLREGQGTAAKVLRRMGVDLERVRKMVEEAMGREAPAHAASIQLGAQTKRVLELAFDEARRLDQIYVGTEHLLLGLVRQGEGIAAGILETLGLDLEEVRRETFREMQMRSHPASQPRRGKKSESLVEQLGIDLTEEAREGKLDPVIGRHKEIERVVQILSRRTKNNPALIGEAGVGKTAIVEGLAQRIASGEVPERLIEKRVVMLDVGALCTGASLKSG